MEKLRGLHEAALHLSFISLIFGQREVEQGLPVAGNGRQLLALFTQGLGGTADIARIEERNGLQEVSVAYLAEDAPLGARGTHRLDETAMASFRTLVAIPVFAQLMPRGRIHRGDQLERVQGLSARVHFFKDDADSFL